MEKELIQWFVGVRFLMKKKKMREDLQREQKWIERKRGVVLIEIGMKIENEKDMQELYQEDEDQMKEKRRRRNKGEKKDE